MTVCTLWFTGLSGSGKTTIANELMKSLNNKSIQAVLLDGDVVRKNVSYDIGYTKEDRDIHIKKVAGICHIINMSGIMAIACVISPTENIRMYARNLIKNFVEVYIECPIDVCKSRDVKGLYKQVNDGLITEFVGINIPYEVPVSPEIIIKTDKETIEESVNKILNYLKQERV